VSALAVRDAYRRWAPRYAGETAVSLLENHTVVELGVQTAGRRLLDVGCGTARRLRESGASLAVGVDFTTEMLLEGAGDLVAGDVRALPIGRAAFDVVWCRLVIGHVAELDAAYAELARVCRPGGSIVVTDFHPDAVAAGHRRTFRDGDGVVREVEHYVHALDAHCAAALSAGLRLVTHRDGVVGPVVRDLYAHADRLEAYEEQRGLPLVLALAFRRT
jgi:malonyl-CoA O-methyltransferase